MRVSLSNVVNTATHAQVFHVVYGTPDAVAGDMLTRDGLPMRWGSTLFNTLASAEASASDYDAMALETDTECLIRLGSCAPQLTCRCGTC